MIWACRGVMCWCSMAKSTIMANPASLCAAPILEVNSDTETLLACFADGALSAPCKLPWVCLPLPCGIETRGILDTGRDRLGEKPLYYGWQDDVLLFASELNAICAWPGCSPELNRNALTLYMRHGFIPAPHSIWQGSCQAAAGLLGAI